MALESLHALNDLDSMDPDLNLLPAINTKIFNYSNFPLNHSLSCKFSLFHANVRSLPRNSNELLNCLHLIEHSFTVTALTETWLQDSNKDLYPIPGYRSLNAIRSEQRGGGVSLYFRNDIAYKPRPDISIFTHDLESVFAEVILPICTMLY